MPNNSNLFNLNLVPEAKEENIKEVTKKGNVSTKVNETKKSITNLSFLQKKTNSKIFKGIYFEEDLWNYIQIKTKDTGMSNSEIINKMVAFVKSQEK